MAETTKLQTLVDNYNWLVYEFSDQRVKDWPMVPSPVPMLLLTAVYLVIIWRGPHWMKHRQPFQIRPLITVYNFFMVVLSAHLTYELFISTVWRPRSEYSLICQSVDYGDHPLTLRLARAVWLYYIAKLIEYFDTIFFVLRKKNSQISFLHVYHHVGVAMSYWAIAAYGPGGETSFGPMANSFIHVWMYTYYLIAGLGPRFQKYLWWKRYMTVMQLVQFFVIMAKTGVIIVFDCGFPRVYLVITCIYIPTIALLFVNFYRQTYNRKKAAALQDKTLKAETTVQKNGVQNGVHAGTSNGHHLHRD